jgi:hypothetical protein
VGEEFAKSAVELRDRRICHLRSAPHRFGLMGCVLVCPF